ncbi:MAG: hypothetical protein J0I20_33950 [Chloroflexi bacterium]|nr:hypothetical protein [Chloroflexota bacterium]OJW05602.1 MAG: hypothetical protein BGO39_03015 [Chloroflexi bacterium 54-19]
MYDFHVLYQQINQPTLSSAVDVALVILSGFISAFILPPLVGFLTAKTAPGWVKSLIASVLALVEALVAVWLAGELNWTNYAATALTVLLAAGASYKTVTGEISKKAQETGLQIGANTTS